MTAHTTENPDVRTDELGWVNRLSTHWSRWTWNGSCRPPTADWRPGIPLQPRPDGFTHTQTVRPMLAVLDDSYLRTCQVSALVWCHKCRVGWNPIERAEPTCWFCKSETGVGQYPPEDS